MTAGRYVLWRLVHACFVVIAAATLVFVVMRVVPGDPAAIFAGPSASVDQINAVRVDLGLDKPLPLQYVEFLGGLIRLDLGRSYRLGVSATQVVGERIPATAVLAGAAMLLALLMSFPLGILAAVRARSRTDYTIELLSLLGQALPNFWVGIVLILVFGRVFHLLPSFGAHSPTALVLPAVTLALPFIGLLTRLVRSGLLDVLNEPYIVTARSKGLAPVTVLVRHAMKNMLIPVVTVIGLQFGLLLAGAVVVEVVFGWPGVGRVLIDAISNRDYAVVQVAVIFISTTFALLSLLVDVVYVYLDPRIRLASA